MIKKAERQIQMDSDRKRKMQIVNNGWDIQILKDKNRQR